MKSKLTRRVVLKPRRSHYCFKSYERPSHSLGRAWFLCSDCLCYIGPLEIGSSLLKHFIANVCFPRNVGVWFDLHFVLNMLSFLLLIVAQLAERVLSIFEFPSSISCVSINFDACYLFDCCLYFRLKS
jgi:hypothetical protein